MWSRTVRVIVTLALGLLAALRAADAQPRQNIPIIGVLANDDLSAALANPKSPVSALWQGLREMGYVEGPEHRHGVPASRGETGSPFHLLAEPGGNITGTTGLSSGLMGKQFELLKEVAPTVTRVAAIEDRRVPSTREQ
jgi:hypothetical protein